MTFEQALPLGWRETTLAAVILTILLAIFFWPAVFAGQALLPTDLIFQLDPLWQPLAPKGFTFPGNQLLSDQVYQFYPWKLYAVGSLAAGRIPLWNPYINSGQPFLANAQTAIFSPFTLLSLLFPLHTSFVAAAFLVLFVAGFFTFLLAREIGIGKYGALAAMITFAFSGSIIVLPGHPHTQAMAWLPALLFFTERAFTRQNKLYVLAAGATVGVPAERASQTLAAPLGKRPLAQSVGGADGKFVRWTDLRLMRRMERDATHRAYDPQQTLAHWHYVRKSELRHIVPYINTTDYIVASGLPYELPVMRVRLLEHFEKWAEQCEGDPLREDAFTRAKRVYNLLKGITPVEDDSPIPPDSLLREFIGGSCYKY